MCVQAHLPSDQVVLAYDLVCKEAFPPGVMLVDAAMVHTLDFAPAICLLDSHGNLLFFVIDASTGNAERQTVVERGIISITAITLPHDFASPGTAASSQCCQSSETSSFLADTLILNA